MKEIKIPEIALVLLVGPSSSGKSTFAKKHFLPTEIVSSDACRALVSDDENDLTATHYAFDVLHTIAAARLKMGKLVVIDALNIRKEDRAGLVKLAQDNYALAVALVLETPIRTLFDRHETRTDRKFGKSVLERQYDDFKRSLQTIKKEKFRVVHFVDPSDENIAISRQKLWNNRKEEHGPFDIIGDIHGCFDELVELLNKLGYAITKSPEGHFAVTPPEGRRVIFLGDLTDRGDNSPEVLRLVMDMVKTEQAFCICGNHDDKLLKHLLGKQVSTEHGLEKTITQFAAITPEFRDEVKAFLDSLIAHYVLDDGKLIVTHAGLPEEMHGRASASVRAFCLFGEVTGEIDAFGLPVRHDWAKNYKSKAMVVYGHTPIPKVEWLNNTINIDSGCVFGGKLSCLRYPEKEIVQVTAKAVYCEPVRPQIADEVAETKDEFDDLLDINLVRGKNVIETSFQSKIIIREENAIAAMEVMSRFAISPQWLIYLPPTMSPPETSQIASYLEHPEEVFAYYLKNGITEVICQEKHMGSRAIAVVCKTPEVAVKRFGLAKASLGTVYTRTGRQFFGNKETEREFLEMLQQALTDSGFWEKHDTDWVCLDGELLPWSAKAKDLIIKQYAAVGSAATLGLSASIGALMVAKSRGIATDALLEDLTARQSRIEDYKTAYRHYCRETNGMEGIVYAPFHLLATENKTYFNQSHTWHLENIQAFCNKNTTHLMVTANTLVNLQDVQSREEAINWWVTRTATGGEGMVVKPIQFIATHKGRMIQPAMKCRGSEYLRIIYGPEYDTPENITRLKDRSVKVKRDLAIKEFTLGLESLDRFIKRKSLGRVHECVFGVLALESEAVDPRL
jgi:protein phosphatase